LLLEEAAAPFEELPVLSVRIAALPVGQRQPVVERRLAEEEPLAAAVLKEHFETASVEELPPEEPPDGQARRAAVLLDGQVWKFAALLAAVLPVHQPD
jgi:hypothetical protein